MVNKPVVFISSTSDLRSARELVGKVLYCMGYEPVWQDIEATDGGELLDVLRNRLDPCSLVVQLVGRRYGAEPPKATLEFGRVSYTQFEAVHAETLGRKVIYYFIDPPFPTDAVPPESDECRSLQSAYRIRLIDSNKLRQTNINSTLELELSIHRTRDEFAEIRKESDRRFQEMRRLAAGAFDGVADLKDELSALRDEIRAAIAPKPLPQGQTTPEALPPALIDKAMILLERGNAQDQALAKIAVRRHAEADRIIQELKHKPGNPIDEAFRLLTMEGDNWYQAGQPDKAFEPYEQALSLGSTDLQARHNATLAHVFARLGNIDAHQRRAIEIAEATLKLITDGSVDWAATQNVLGVAWGNLTTGNRGENVRKAIAACEAALTVFIKDTARANWALTQNNLGNAWCNLPTGDRSENLRKAIVAYEAALTVRTRDADPISWANTQHNLGVAWHFLRTGDRHENLRKAIAAYEAALTVRTKDADPTNWAETQNNLGVAWSNVWKGDRGENLRKAIAAYEAALTVRTRDANPTDWAATQSYLGIAWSFLPTGDRGENLSKAIAAYEAAFTVRTKDADPTGWAATQSNLGTARSFLPTGDWDENLRKAITAYEAALTVFTKDTDRDNWAAVQNTLGATWSNVGTGDRSENLRKAIVAYEAALTVCTRETDPTFWAMTQNNLGNAWNDVPTGDRGQNLCKAIGAYEAALTVRTRDADPTNWAMAHINLGIAFGCMAERSGEDRVAWLGRAIASDKAALLVYTAEGCPQDHANAEKNLGIHRRAYEAAGGAATRRFDQIGPAD